MKQNNSQNILAEVAQLTSQYLDVNSSKATFYSHRKTHNTVIANECWFGDDPPDLGDSFTSTKAIKRHRQIRQILKRAETREHKNGDDAVAAIYSQFRKRLSSCRPGRRCGCSVCPKCARASQRAKIDAHLKAIAELSRERKGKDLVLVTIAPPAQARQPGHFLELNPLKANRWLRDVLDRARIKRVVIGSIDLGWERRAGDKYLQLHWHLGMWTNDRKTLVKKLKKAFKPEKWRTDHKYKQPIQLKRMRNLNVIPYMHKLVKLPKLLRSCRRILPELMRLLGRYESMDFLSLRKMRLSAQSGGVVFKEIKSSPTQKVVTRIGQKGY